MAATETAAPTRGAAEASAGEGHQDPGFLDRLEPVVCRVLCVPSGAAETPVFVSRRQDQVTHRLFNLSITVSAVRCLLSYVFIPVVLPAVGGVTNVPPGVGLPIGALALVFDVVALRRFWVSRHRWRWAVTAIYLVVMGLVSALLVGDVTRLA
ncbi:MAG TPA: hypothetical protein VKR22_14270 [Acidimicrobiales bacterium]|nr:hypothetical protein [Acidimicrobiales bacterium]